MIHLHLFTNAITIPIDIRTFNALKIQVILNFKNKHLYCPLKVDFFYICQSEHLASKSLGQIEEPCIQRTNSLCRVFPAALPYAMKTRMPSVVVWLGCFANLSCLMRADEVTKYKTPVA